MNQSTNAPPNSTVELMYGWREQPQDRGTLDIIWSCFLVIFISIWTVLHINLPKPDEGYWSILIRKTRWCILSIYAPEFVTLLAASQRASAKASVIEMHEIGVKGWTLTHGFFADSGGFILNPPDGPAFPVNSRALHYLVKNRYVEAPELTKDEIVDKSKADIFAKCVAVIQGSYLVIQCIARPIQHLKTSTLELFTVAFVVSSAVTFWMWIHKPLDAQSPIHIKSTVPMSTIILKADAVPKSPLWDTPMDFVEQPGWSLWRRRRFFTYFGGLEVRPLQRIPNDYVPPPPTLRLAYPLYGLAVFYAAIHVCAWNFDFPTRAELIIWRAASVTLLADLFIWGLVECLSIKPGFDYTITILGIWEKKCSKDSTWRHYAVDMPATISAILYFVARTVLIGETIASLRLMPATVFICVEWSNFLPHF